LGGQDFTDRILEYVVAEFMYKHRIDLKSNPRSISILREVCERIKCGLSSLTEVRMEMAHLFNNINFNVTLTQNQFVELCANLFDKIKTSLDNALCNARMAKQDIQEVFVVGKSTLMPKIQAMITEYFPSIPIINSNNADETPAYGAAIQNAIMSGDMSPRNSILLDAMSLGIGFETTGGVMVPCKPFELI
jgi:molecular chaperone DnaK (HSP70)